jgi:glutamate 5-kinase
LARSSEYKRVVVKIGTSILVDDERKINPAMFRDLARQVRAARAMGVEVIVVSSGAIASGMEALGLTRKPKEIDKRQALASIGQIILMNTFTKTFAEERLRVGQVLLTHEDIKNKERCLNVMNTINALLAMDIVPVINENDALSFKEIRFGDNDNLSALIAQISDADLLMLLSDVDGLYEKDPNRYRGAAMIPVVKKIDGELEKVAGDTRTEQSTGGMVSKLEAAKKAGSYGIPTRVVRGSEKDIIVRLLRGETVGTLFLPERKLARRKWWTAYAFKVRGVLWVDDGATEAICCGGKSLLPSGITVCDGDFRRGECVELRSKGSGRTIARGIVNYGAAEVERIKGIRSADIEKRLGYKYAEEIIHRDNMVLL